MYEDSYLDASYEDRYETQDDDGNYEQMREFQKDLDAEAYDNYLAEKYGNQDDDLFDDDADF